LQSEAEFIIDGQPCTVDVGGSPAFSFGAAETLSRPDTDPTFFQDWYGEGFRVFRFLDDAAFASLHYGVTHSIARIVASLGVEVTGFELEKYHHFVRDDATHFQVVRLTRDLFPADFNFPITATRKRLERLLGFGLTDIDPDTGDKLHIIIRINRPGSSDYNPPHKDIYEVWDAEAVIPKFVNFWIPACGVSPQSSLPVGPGSHLLPEDRIYRTVEGGVVAGKTYRVRSILHWDGSNRLHRPPVGDGEVIVFSSHLIHGCAINEQEDTTRVALEFRLFRNH
jgi:Phytanoyl-CoA dioxygenase (PhyH)